MHRFRTLFLGQSLRVNRSITLPHVFISSSGFGTYIKTSSFGAISRLHFATVLIALLPLQSVIRRRCSVDSSHCSLSLPTCAQTPQRKSNFTRNDNTSSHYQLRRLTFLLLCAVADAATREGSLRTLRGELARLGGLVMVGLGAAIIRVSVRCRVRTLSTSRHSKAKAK